MHLSVRGCQLSLGPLHCSLSLCMRTTTIFLLSLLFPTVACAASLDAVLRDAGLMQDVLEQMDLEQQAQAADAVREAGDEVFPKVPGEGSSSATGTVLDEDPVFLTARVEGVPVIFKDVPKDSWFAPYVRAVTGEGIVSGYRAADGTLKGLFGPADSLTIGQLAKIAVQLAKVDVGSCGSIVKNQSVGGTWAEIYVRCAEQRGWAVYADGSVDPSGDATRAEVIATLLQALAVKIVPRTGGVFSDVDSSVEFAAAVEMAAKAGVVSGDSDTQGNFTGFFRPRDSVKRAEVAKIVTNSVQVFGQ